MLLILILDFIMTPWQRVVLLNILDSDGGTEEIIVYQKIPSFNDNVKAVFMDTGEDLDIFHDGTDSTIDNAVGDLIISNWVLMIKIFYLNLINGSGGRLLTYFYLDGSQTGDINFQKDAIFADR